MLRLPQIAALILIATFDFRGGAMAARAVPEDQIIGTILVTAGPSTGSGFYLMTAKGASFVTAKHVLYDEKEALRAEKVHLLSYSIKRDSAGTLIELDLKQSALRAIRNRM
jgi:hypothetical protein